MLVGSEFRVQNASWKTRLGDPVARFLGTPGGLVSGLAAQAISTPQTGRQEEGLMASGGETAMGVMKGGPGALTTRRASRTSPPGKQTRGWSVAARGRGPPNRRRSIGNISAGTRPTASREQSDSRSGPSAFRTTTIRHRQPLSTTSRCKEFRTAINTCSARYSPVTPTQMLHGVA
jgi:hypothetical protein